MLNSVNIMGRLVRSPELRKTQNGVAVCSFTIACNRRGKDAGVDFIDIVAWRQCAEFVAEYFKKGDAIIVTGSLSTRTYQDKQGNNRKAVEVIASEVNFGGGKREPVQSDEAQSGAQFEDISDLADDELPF